MADHPIALTAGAYSKTRATGLRRPISRTEFVRYSSLLAIGILPYLNTLWNGLVYDDQFQIVQNPFLRSFHYLGLIFTTSVWTFQVQHGVVTYYRPLMTFAYLLIYRAVGPVPYAYHLLNLIIHCAIVFLLFAITRRVFKSDFMAWTTAIVFGIHPIHTEVVAWVAALPDLEMTVFVLAGFWYYLNYTGSRGKRWLMMLATCVSYFMALLSKEPALLFPGLLIAYEIVSTDSKDPSLRKRILRQAPLWALSLIYGVARFFAFSGIIPNAYRISMSGREVFLSAISLFGSYVQKLIFPWPLNAFYPFHATSSALDGRFLLGAACLAVLMASFAVAWKRHSLMGLAIAWLFLPLLPVLDAKVMASNVFAERYLYLPSIGFCWLFAALVQRINRWMAVQPKFPIQMTVAALATLLFGAASYAVVSRNVAWHDEARLFSSMLKLDPTNATVRADLGATYWNQSRKDQALFQWRTAISEDPNNIFALDNLGIAAASANKYDEAIRFFRRAISAKPGFSRAHAHLASALENSGDYTAAEEEYRQTLELSPFDVGVRNDYAMFCSKTGQPELADAQYRLSLSVAPSSAALDALGRSAIRNHDVDTSTKLFHEATKLDPYDSVAHFGLAESYETLGRLDEAVVEYERGLETDPSNQRASSSLAKLKLLHR